MKKFIGLFLLLNLFVWNCSFGDSNICTPHHGKEADCKNQKDDANRVVCEYKDSKCVFNKSKSKVGEGTYGAGTACNTPGKGSETLASNSGHQGNPPKVNAEQKPAVKKTGGDLAR